MSKRLFTAVLGCVVAGSLSHKLSAQTPIPESIAADVAKNVKDLGDPSPQKVDAAEIRLLSGGVNEFPAIEAAAAHPGLPPAVASKLTRIIAVMKPLQPARLRVAAANAALVGWRQKDAVGAYDAAGKKDPKWDAAAKSAIMAFADDQGQSEATQATVGKAVRLGCTDPYVLAIAAECAQQMPTPDFVSSDKYLKQASVAIQSSSYPPHIKFQVDVDAAGQLAMHGEPIANDPSLPPPPEDMGPSMMVFSSRTTGEVNSLLHKAAAIWPRVIKEADIPSRVLEDLANRYVDAAAFPLKKDQKILDDMLTPLTAALPNDPATLNFEARYHYNWAWQIRKGKAYSKMSKDEAKEFEEHLHKAEPLLSKSATANPNDPESSDLMISLILDLYGRESRQSMDKWFKHAIAINPDDVDAYRALKRTVLPQWGGTKEQLTDFVKQCVLTMNYHAGIPFIATEIYDSLGDLDPAMWRQPNTWQTIGKIYTPWLEANPDDNKVRSRYAYLACRCGQWKEAKAQFALLGDKAVEGQFGGMHGALRMWKRQADAH